MTSAFGPRIPPRPGASSQHKAIDIGAREGTPIRAVADGVVTMVARNYNERSGNVVIIQHELGWESHESMNIRLL